MTNMMNYTVTSHGGDDVKPIRHRSGRQLAGVVGGLRPGRFYLVLPPKDAEHRPMVSPGELGGGGIGDQ
jgi:hypothetical protein